MFVNLNTETINRHCLSLLTFSWPFPRSHDCQSSLYVVHSGQCSADKVTSMKIFSNVYIVITKKVDSLKDFFVNGFTINVRVLICLLSVRCLLLYFARGGKLSFLAQVLSTVASTSCYYRLHEACLELGPVTGRSSRAFLCTSESEVLYQINKYMCRHVVEG